MIKQKFKHTHRIIIDPGEYYVSNKQEVISTLLGSCVAACLYDPVNKVIGMNHFLLAYRHHSFTSPTIQSEEGRYGLNAMELLINDMMAKGAIRRHIKAKCFGGGDVLHLRGEIGGRKSVGGANIDFIREFLQDENIPMVGSALGGNHGRNVHFVGDDYSVFVKTIGKQREKALEQEERVYWQKSIKEHEQAAAKQAENQAEFW
ncbi:MAG: chemotaxis protein CheD [Gammaproteobacteria bacterium]|nr:MAG: chemotaxis protein CheD [Gammaproteobacteria bacterium]